jgi:hypothetical protein
MFFFIPLASSVRLKRVGQPYIKAYPNKDLDNRLHSVEIREVRHLTDYVEFLYKVKVKLSLYLIN